VRDDVWVLVRKELSKVVYQTLILALTLRGPSGGHCVGLSVGLHKTQGED
jgi:hypothetical protein